MTKIKFGLPLAAAMLLSAAGANAATWTFNNTDTNTQGNVTATAKDYANSGTGGTITSTDVTLGYNGASGLGVFSGTDNGSPTHAVDNNQYIDSILFTFSDGDATLNETNDKVNLTSAYFGYVSGDSDYSVFAYTGTGSSAPSFSGVTYGNLTSNGWTLVGHYDGGASEGSRSFTSGMFPGAGNGSGSAGIYSSYWLIGAYTLTTAGNDYFKLASVSGTTCKANPTVPGCATVCTPGTPGCGGGGVPEPGTLLLMSAGLIGLGRFNKRRAQA